MFISAPWTNFFKCHKWNKISRLPSFGSACVIDVLDAVRCRRIWRWINYGVQNKYSILPIILQPTRKWFCLDAWAHKFLATWSLLVECSHFTSPFSLMTNMFSLKVNHQAAFDNRLFCVASCTNLPAIRFSSKWSATQRNLSSPPTQTLG